MQRPCAHARVRRKTCRVCDGSSHSLITSSRPFYSHSINIIHHPRRHAQLRRKPRRNRRWTLLKHKLAAAHGRQGAVSHAQPLCAARDVKRVSLHRPTWAPATHTHPRQRARAMQQTAQAHAPIRSAAGPLPELIRHHPLIHMQRARAAHACLAQIDRHRAAALNLEHVGLGAEFQAVLHVNAPAVSRD